MDAIKLESFQYYTYDDYIKWEDRWELIDGIAYSMSPAPYPKHQKIVARVWQELNSHLECLDTNCEAYISPIDWKISENTVVQPDVAIFCEDDNRQFFSKTPPLIVEVLSKATALKDVTTKFKLYEKEKVEFYIIVEPNQEEGDIFILEDGEYRLLKHINRDDKFEFTSNLCRGSIDFGKIFSK